MSDTSIPTAAPSAPPPSSSSTAAAATTPTAAAVVPFPTLSNDESEAALNRFSELLRFETVSRTAPDTGAYQACANWLVQQLKSIAPLRESTQLLKEAPDHSPVVVACWKGSNESLPVLLLNSHYDVVPAPASDWSPHHPPFGGVRDQGKIYGRGTQDMKSVCLQYIEALRYVSLHKPEWEPTRSIYLTFVPDEEIGGAGMAAFLESELYHSLPGIALALDEGLANTTEILSVFYGERIPWFVQVTATGPTGHGSRFIDNTAIEQLLELCDKALQFRTGQRAVLGLKHDENCAHAVAAKAKQKTISPVQDLGEVTSLNITSLEAGVKSGGEYAYNCVPPTAQCSLDIRISPHTNPKEIGDMLDVWCRECSRDPECGAGLSWSYLGRGHDGKTHHLTSTKPEVNPWYQRFETSLQQLGLNIEPQVFPAATDSRFLRALGIKALGFSPMRSTPTTPCDILLHEINECIPEQTFLEGIAIYVHLIQSLASAGAELD